MESDNILQGSKDELDRISRTTAMDAVVINMNKLDRRTKSEMINAITNVITSRRAALNNMLLGVK